MKRWNEDFAGRPRSHSSGHKSVTLHDTAPLAGLTDFMSGDQAIASGRVRAPDPVFRDRLRRRLWRMHAILHLGEGRGTH